MNICYCHADWVICKTVRCTIRAGDSRLALEFRSARASTHWGLCVVLDKANMLDSAVLIYAHRFIVTVMLLL